MYRSGLRRAVSGVAATAAPPVLFAAAAVALSALGGMASLSERPLETGPCSEDPPPDAPSPDLYCVTLLPVPALRGAMGRAEMRRVPSPFGVTVTSDGEPLYDLHVRAEGLPPPAELGPYRAYVAWATTPVLHPLVRIGELRGGRAGPGRVSFPRFLVLVSAEASDTASERRGPLVLRGTSPSMRVQPHEVARLMASLTGISAMPPGAHPDATPAPGETDRGAHGVGAGKGEEEMEWTLPPMHPRAQMIPAMAALRPDVAPLRPAAPDGSAVPFVGPREVAELRDGDTLVLVAERVRRTLTGRPVLMYGFNGQHPGPLVRVSQGATIVVDFTNRLDLPTSVHWHGVRLENRYDGAVGVTQEAVPPEGRFEYRVHFPDAGIYWYHPHHREDVAQELGLYGNLWVRSERADYSGPASREEVLMLDDLLIGESGIVPFGRERSTHALTGRFGNLFLVNGEPDYRLDVRPGEVVRFLLTNAASTRTFNLSLGSVPLKLVGTDLGNLQRQERVESVVLAPAERYVVEALFARPGEVALTNRVLGFDHALGIFFPEVDTLGVVRVAGEPADSVPASSFGRLRSDVTTGREIRSYERYFARPVERELVLELETAELPFSVDWMLRRDSVWFAPVEWSGTMPLMSWSTTGRRVRWVLRDPATGKENREIDDWRFRVGEVIKLRLVNERRSLHGMQHPIHIHGQRFLILSQSGVPNDNLAWKDTILLPAGSTAEMLLELSNPGDWMLHCHIAEHLEAGMQMVFTVEP